MSDLKLSRETMQDSPKTVVMSIAGEIDQTNGREVETYFNDLMDSEKPHHVLVDLSDLAFAGSGFFGSLLFWKEEVSKAGGLLVLFALRPEIASTMRIFSVDRIVTICSNREAAVKKVKEA